MIITTRGVGENSVVPLARHNHAVKSAIGPDEWFGVILADHGLVATFCTEQLAEQFLKLVLKDPYTVKCNNCEWQGYDEWLTMDYDACDGEITKVCPNCRTDAYLMDI